MKKIWKYLLILTLLIVFWNQTVVGPFKAVSLVFHKVGHALASALSGFGVSAFRMIYGNSGDIVFGANSWIASFIIANSGYISSILFCLFIFFLKKTKLKKYTVGSITIIYIAISIVFNSSIKTLVTSLAFSGMVILILMMQKESLNDLMIDIIGMSMAAYVIYDTFVNTILLKLNGQLSIVQSWGTQPPEDIVRLSELTGFPTLIWGGIWLAITVVSVNILLIKVISKK
ncbi:MAG: M50 family peptidase [Clostridiaceae bacterium]|jgi:hypothetical protein|nr:M50 family peptidase [Clostridiaceae bacterium]